MPVGEWTFSKCLIQRLSQRWGPLKLLSDFADAQRPQSKQEGHPAQETNLGIYTPFPHEIPPPSFLMDRTFFLPARLKE